ncbi:MAG: ATP-binding protein [Anaerolineae bacterium]|nr:ATP-binding protein [Anaerolineae bacterium]
MIPEFRAPLAADSVLTWALVAVSLFNTILLLWLGMTLWLHAGRRSAGVVVAVGGFLLGSALFISHSALLLSETLSLTRSNTLWLAVGMTPAIILPYVWYGVLLWYNGYWAERAGDPPGVRRHQKWLWLTSAIVAIGFVCLVLLGLPYTPVVGRLAPLVDPVRQLVKISFMDVPLVAFGYPLYVLLCVALSLDVLRSRPGPAGRLLEDARGGGEQVPARWAGKARPWLMAATLLLLAVGCLVVAVMVWTITNTRVRGYYILTPDRLQVIGRFDLVISALIAAVTILLGQAMTAYELFMGKVLPRRGLARQWKWAIALAASYGVLMGGALVWGLEPVYAVLLTALMMATFFALLGWRSHVEWEQAMRQLRPFVASQRWYDALVASPGEATGQRPPDPFGALCENLLNTTVAHLIPVGPTAAFVSPQSYPPQSSAPALGPLAQQASEDAWLILPVEPGDYGGATWAVSLWRERGLIGVLLFGPRRDEGLYTQEQIEVARSVSERLIDTAASLALSQRLMRLQRERMASTQILDQSTRRVLHDEVLPLIHAAMLSLAVGKPVGEPAIRAAIEQLSGAHGQVSNLLRELPPTVAPEISRLGLMAALRKAVEVEFAHAFAEVTWRCDEGVEAQMAALSPVAAETLYYAAREMVRNAAKHAHPDEQSARPCLEIAARVASGQVQITIEDNGSGFRPEPGVGQGLALHSTLMAIVGGSLSLETVHDQMTRAQLALPLPA